MKMKALSFAIGAVMAIGSTQVQSDELLFPYFKSGNGAYSFLSMQSFFTLPTLGGLTALTDDKPIHYVVNYDDAVQGACTHFDFFGSMTDNDMIQQTVNNPAFSTLDLPALFGDASTANYLLSAGETEGFVMVADLSPEASFFGQMIVVDTVLGTVAAYKGINDILNFNNVNVLPPVPTLQPTVQGNFNTLGFTTHLTHMFSWYPEWAVDTSWFVLVTGTDMGRAAGWDGRTQLFPVVGAVWDRDENPISGQRTRNIQCYATIDRTDFLNGAQQLATVDGGLYWGAHLPRVTSVPTPNPLGFGVGDDCFTSGVPFGTTGAAPTCRATGTIAMKIETTNELGAPITMISEENPWPNVR